MAHSFYHSMHQLLLSPTTYFIVLWSLLLIVLAGVASISAEYTFMFSLSPSSSLSQSCVTKGLAGLPLDIPREVICVPAHLVKASRFDALVPFVLAALLVSASANLIKNVLFLADDHIDEN